MRVAMFSNILMSPHARLLLWSSLLRAQKLVLPLGLVTPKGVLLLAACDASATRESS